MSSGQIEYASLNGTYIFKIVGEVRASSCLTLDKVLSKIDPAIITTGVVVDLTQTTFIDSTILGILAKLGLKLKKQQTQPVLLSTNPDITILLNSMGLNQIFIILNYSSQPQQSTQILPEEITDQHQMLEMVLEAHAVLIQLSEHNQHIFAPLVRQLEQVSQLQ